MVTPDASEKQNGQAPIESDKLLIGLGNKEKALNKENEMIEMSNGKNAASPRPEVKRLLTTDYEEMYKTTPLTDDTSCGYGFLRNSFLQK